MINQTLVGEGTQRRKQILSAKVNVAYLGNLPKQIMFCFVFGHFSWENPLPKNDLVILPLTKLLVSIPNLLCYWLSKLQENL